MGGIGKTEIATEFIHRHIDNYEIIWWIRAEHHDRVTRRAGQAGPAAGAPAGDHGQRTRPGDRGRTETLESGVRPSWLLVYDNAAQPLELQRYLPACPPGGHIIITSRLRNWPGYIEADSIDVAPFTEEDAISFLRRRVPSLASSEKLRRGRRHAAER